MPDVRWISVIVFVYFEYLIYDNKIFTLLETLECEVVLLDKRAWLILLLLSITE